MHRGSCFPARTPFLSSTGSVLEEDVDFVYGADRVAHFLEAAFVRAFEIMSSAPFEPGWEGFVTLEISNTTPLPAKIYANEGIAQVLFFESDEECLTSYADRKGMYQAQKGITLPKVG